MKPDISEFSYGYAVTEELARWAGSRLTAAPVFPSLVQEGRVGGGYDVRIDIGGLPLFLQFKLSDCMVRNTAEEVSQGLFTPPFYRMHLRPTRHSNQHKLLLDLEALGGNIVAYAAPMFHTTMELNTAYLRRQVLLQSIFILPGAIGSLPDNRDHHISFKDNHTTYRFSEPVEIEVLMGGESFATYVKNGLRERTSIRASESYLQQLSEGMIEILHQRSEEEWEGINFGDIGGRPLEKISYLARTFFSCEFYMVGWKPKEQIIL